MMLTKYMAKQLGRPKGLFGRFIMGGKLDRLNASMNDLAFEQLAPVQGEMVLEIGFGGGGLLRRLLQAGCGVTGVELSPEMVARLRSKLPARDSKGRADIRVGSVDFLPFRDGAFQKACSVNTIYFWKDLPAALREVHRVLVAGGLFVVCFNPARELERWPGHRHGFNLYTAQQVEHLLLEAGFALVSTTRDEDPKQGEFVCVSASRRESALPVGPCQVSRAAL